MGVVGGKGAPLSQVVDFGHIETLVITSAPADYIVSRGELIQNLSDLVIITTAPPHQMLESNPSLAPDVTTTAAKGKAGQRTQKSLTTLERDKLLTTQQAWDIAKDRGCTKSRDAFRAWSRRSPEKCRELYGLIVITDPQQSKLIGYQDDQANETLEK